MRINLLTLEVQLNEKDGRFSGTLVFEVLSSEQFADGKRRVVGTDAGVDFFSAFLHRPDSERSSIFNGFEASPFSNLIAIH